VVFATAAPKSFPDHVFTQFDQQIVPESHAVTALDESTIYLIVHEGIIWLTVALISIKEPFQLIRERSWGIEWVARGVFFRLCG
jgi:hypothetical protein